MGAGDELHRRRVGVRLHRCRGHGLRASRWVSLAVAERGEPFSIARVALGLHVDRAQRGPSGSRGKSHFLRPISSVARVDQVGDGFMHGSLDMIWQRGTAKCGMRGVLIADIITDTMAVTVIAIPQSFALIRS